jgi:hypothetical protein
MSRHEVDGEVTSHSKKVIARFVGLATLGRIVQDLEKQTNEITATMEALDPGRYEAPKGRVIRVRKLFHNLNPTGDALHIEVLKEDIPTHLPTGTTDYNEVTHRPSEGQPWVFHNFYGKFIKTGMMDDSVWVYSEDMSVRARIDEGLEVEEIDFEDTGLSRG